jgi:sulfate adenylyltransferase subunit 1 (EFTu-like GTPase family)
VKHTTRTTIGFVEHVTSRLDVNALALEPGDTLESNDIGVITISTADPLVVDPYTHNRITGSFVLVDERTNATLAGAMVGEPTFAT